MENVVRRRLKRGQRWVFNNVIHPDVVLFLHILVRNGHRLQDAYDKVWPENPITPAAISQFFLRLRKNKVVAAYYEACCTALNREREIIQSQLVEQHNVLTEIHAAGDMKNYATMSRVFNETIKAHGIIKSETTTEPDLSQITEF